MGREETEAMEAGGAHGGGGSGGPAPFLLKTYDMVDDSTTDGIVSWSSSKCSFVVWNPPDFSRILLPTYFKHNNFSSFIRQLNTYGFRKIDPERWEFANDEFVKGKQQLLKNIHRRKPIHSHSNPPPNLGSDPERAAFEEEIDRLSREKSTLEADSQRSRQHHTAIKSQLKELEGSVADLEQRQQKMIAFLEKASRNPVFVEHLIRIVDSASVDFSILSKKRRHSQKDGTEWGPERVGNEHTDDDCIDSSRALEIGNLFPLDFTSKLKLELCPSASHGNSVPFNTQSSEKVAAIPQGRQLEGNQLGRERTSPVTEVAEPMDTGASLCTGKNLALSWQARDFDEADGNSSCHLNLTLASCPSRFDKDCSIGRTDSSSCDVDCVTKSRENNLDSEEHFPQVAENYKSSSGTGDAKEASKQEPVQKKDPVPEPPVGKNDFFWEQFLTERPGSSDSEEASSRLRLNPQRGEA